MTADDWLRTAKSDQLVDCHAIRGPQCAGLSVFRAHLCKISRNPDVLRLPADREHVFATPAEFLDHHNNPTYARQPPEE